MDDCVGVWRSMCFVLVFSFYLRSLKKFEQTDLFVLGFYLSQMCVCVCVCECECVCVCV